MLSQTQKNLLTTLSAAGERGVFLFGRDRRSLATLKERKYIKVADDGAITLSEKGRQYLIFLAEQSA